MNTPQNRIAAETRTDANCFVGFHDIIPWSPDGSRVAVHRADASYAELNDCVKPIDICLWEPRSGTMEKIDSTTAWNFQQGARLQWVPGMPGTLAFNAIENGQAVAVLHDFVAGKRRVLQTPIYAFSPDGKISISPNYTRLAHLWKAYGYPSLQKNPLDTDIDNDGLWQVDLATGKKSLFISTRRAAEFAAAPTIDPSQHFLCHVSFSPDGSRVAFLERYFSADYALVTRLMVTDREAKELKVLAQGMVSHFDWVNNDEILVWTRFSSGLAAMRSSGVLGSPLLKPLLKLARSFRGSWKKRLLSEAYYTIPVADPSARNRVGFPALNRDGHPMIARTHDWIATDFYPDEKNRLPVILYNYKNGTCQELHTFTHHPRSSDTDVKCDLHPRWNRDETQIAVDTCEAGVRQVRVVDVADIVKQ